MANMPEYTTERFKKSIAVSEFIDKYVDVPKFLQFCRECPNYDKIWSCPEYEFDPMTIWGKYQYLDLIVVKASYDEKTRERIYTQEELGHIGKDTLLVEKQKLMDEFLEKEKNTPNSLSMVAGSCDVCSRKDDSLKCTKLSGDPCRHPEKMRYSIDSLGGDVIGAASERKLIVFTKFRD